MKKKKKKTPFWRCFYFFQASYANRSFVSLKSKVTQNNSNAIQAQKFQKCVPDQKILPLFNQCLTKALGSRGGGKISPIWQRLFLAVNKNPEKKMSHAVG